MSAVMLTQTRVKEVLRYEPESGKFFWLVQPGKRSDLLGKHAGTAHNRGYRAIVIDGVKYAEHRLAWFYVYGEFPKEQLDHINRNRTDNRITNLREATRSQNMANSNSKKNKLKGAFWNKQTQRWMALINLGSFDTAEEAHAAYCSAARIRHGEFFFRGIPVEPGVNAV